MVMLELKVAAPSRDRPETSWIQGVEAADQPAGRPWVLMVGPAGAAEEDVGVEVEEAAEGEAALEAAAEGEAAAPEAAVAEADAAEAEEPEAEAAPEAAPEAEAEAAPEAEEAEAEAPEEAAEL